MLQILHILSYFEKYLHNTQYLNMFPEVPVVINQEIKYSLMLVWLFQLNRN